jgi:RNA methyltransferase, TrmH family
MRRISSRQNPLVARFRELARGRGSGGAILLDGEHLVEEALNAGVQLETVAFAERLVDRLRQGSGASTVASAEVETRAEHLITRVERSGADAVRVPEQVLAAMSPARQPSGIVAIARHGNATLEAVLGRQPPTASGEQQLVLLLDGVQDPGNVGAIVRAADGCGATAVIATEGTADPFGWKALRGAMGSTFRVPTASKQPPHEAVAQLKSAGLTLLAAVPHGGRPISEVDLARPLGILLGAEGSGLSAAMVAAADELVTIPMRPPVESLNVAITAALILYEASQQRARRPHVAIR